MGKCGFDTIPSFLFSFPFLLSFSPPFHITAWYANTQRTGDACAFFIPDVSHIRQEQSHNCLINKNRQFWNFVPPRTDGENVDGTITCVSSRTVFFSSTPNDSLTPMRQVLARELKTGLTTVTEGWCGEGEVCAPCGVEEEKNWADGFCKRMQQSSWMWILCLIIIWGIGQWVAGSSGLLPLCDYKLPLIVHPKTSGWVWRSEGQTFTALRTWARSLANPPPEYSRCIIKCLYPPVWLYLSGAYLQGHPYWTGFLELRY